MGSWLSGNVSGIVPIHSFYSQSGAIPDDTITYSTVMFGIDTVGVLPTDILAHIMDYVAIEDYEPIRFVCKALFNFVRRVRWQHVKYFNIDLSIAQYYVYGTFNYAGSYDCSLPVQYMEYIDGGFGICNGSRSLIYEFKIALDQNLQKLDLIDPKPLSKDIHSVLEFISSLRAQNFFEKYIDAEFSADYGVPQLYEREKENTTGYNLFLNNSSVSQSYNFYPCSFMTWLTMLTQECEQIVTTTKQLDCDLEVFSHGSFLDIRCSDVKTTTIWFIEDVYVLAAVHIHTSMLVGDEY
jgi:hypothetical protein